MSTNDTVQSEWMGSSSGTPYDESEHIAREVGVIFKDATCNFD